MKNNTEKLYIVSSKALPQAMLLVVEAKKLIESGVPVAKAVKKIGLSRSTYYKYCDDISLYDETNITKSVDIEVIAPDKVGILSKITNLISKNKFNIITINQNKPIKNLSKITFSLSSKDESANISKLISSLNNIDFINEVKIINEKNNNK